MSPITFQYIEKGWWSYLLTYILNIVLVVAIFATVDYVLKKARKPLPDICAHCGQEMIRSNGFYDFSFVPQWSEIVLAVAYLGTIKAIAILNG